MFSPEEVKVPAWYGPNAMKKSTLLGYIPHKDDNWSYYGCTCEKNDVYVTAVFGSYNEYYSEHEMWYLRPIDPEARAVDAKRHAERSAYHLERMNTHKYIVFFYGPDDGSYIMRFRDEADALELLTAADFFDDFIDMEEMLMY